MELEITVLLFHDIIFPKHQAYCPQSCTQNTSSFYYRTLCGHKQIFYHHEGKHQPEPYSVTLKMEAAHSSKMPKKCTKLLKTIICKIPDIQAWKLHYNKHITILYTKNIFFHQVSKQTASKHAIKKTENDFVQPPHNMCSSNTNFITNIYFKQTKILKICILI